jgi:hypothetical protein
MWASVELLSLELLFAPLASVWNEGEGASIYRREEGDNSMEYSLTYSPKPPANALIVPTQRGTALRLSAWATWLRLGPRGGTPSVAMPKARAL